MKRLALLIGIIVSLACGGGGGVPTTTTGPEMPIATRQAAMAKVEAKAEDLYRTATTTAARNTQLAAYMKALPEFTDAKVTEDESVWGRFTDGRYMVVVNNRLPSWYTGPGRPQAQLPRAAKPGKISTARKARLFHSFGLNFGQQQDPIGEMGTWLTQAGYTVAPMPEGDARLATLRDKVSGDGFFYFNTHGGSFELSQTEKVFCIGSSTLKSDDNERLAEIKADLNSQKVVYMTAPNGETKSILGISYPDFDTRYAITSKFVDAYWSFGENAIVFINACWSGHTAVGNGAGTFILACQRKGAGAYLGWTNKVATPVSENAPRYLVDRLTAANDYNAESPDQRPFFVGEIVADMHRKGLVPGGGAADLICNLKAGVDVGLRPTISYVQMLEPSGTLDVHGEFGDLQGDGSVEVAGRPVNSIESWTNDLIVVKIPDSGAGSFGDVVVKARGKESNKRPLTKWTSNFSYTQMGSGTLKCTITAKLIVRQDLAKTRTRPGDPTRWVTPIPFFISRESTLTWSASGEHRDGNNQLIEKWTGGGTPPIDYTASPGAGNKWLANGAYDPVSGDFGVGLICGGPKSVTGSIAPGGALVSAGGGTFVRTLDPFSFVVAGYSEPPGDITFSFTQWNPVSAPTADTQYRGR